MRKRRLSYPRLTFKDRATHIKKGDVMHIDLKHGLVSFNRGGPDLKFRDSLTLPDDNKILMGKCSPMGIAKLVECIAGIRAFPLRKISTQEHMYFSFGRREK